MIHAMAKDLAALILRERTAARSEVPDREWLAKVIYDAEPYWDGTLTYTWAESPPHPRRTAYRCADAIRASMGTAGEP